jgi:hypothetical protein
MGGKPVVVWYDHTNGQLKGVVATADANPQTDAPIIVPAATVLDSGGSTNAHDVGRFASLAIQSTAPQISVSYLDHSTKQLRLFQSNSDWSSPTITVVDDGTIATGADPNLFVGASTSLKFLAGGNLGIAYQDSTGETLRFAQQSSPTGPVAFSQTLASTGAGGFYASLTYDGTHAFATHAILTALNQNVEGSTLQVVQAP